MHDLYLGVDDSVEAGLVCAIAEATDPDPDADDDNGVGIGTADAEDIPDEAEGVAPESDADVPTDDGADTGKGTQANAALADRVEQEKELSENPELDSLKKFLLIQKLQDLNTNLMKHNILNDSLSTFLEFCNGLSYDTIVSISAGFTDYIAANLKTLTSDGSGKKTA